MSITIRGLSMQQNNAVNSSCLAVCSGCWHNSSLFYSKLFLISRSTIITTKSIVNVETSNIIIYYHHPVLCAVCNCIQYAASAVGCSPQHHHKHTSNCFDTTLLWPWRHLVIGIQECFGSIIILWPQCIMHVACCWRKHGCAVCGCI